MESYTYRVATNGKAFRVEMLYSGNAYKEWTPWSEPYATLEEAERERDRIAATPLDRWVAVGVEKVQG